MAGKRLLLLLTVLLILLTGCSREESAGPCQLDRGIAILTQSVPDLGTLDGCQTYARILSRRYGPTILVGEDVQQVTPWDYDLESETDPQAIAGELKLLDRHLSVYPEDLLKDVSKKIGGLHLSLVRGIHGKAGLGGLQDAAGLQYEEEGRLYIALAEGQTSGHTVYHELFHIMETVVLKETDVYNRWELLNPPQFTYDYDYLQNQHRDGSEYLEKDTRAFIDAYAMSFPTEDRARLMEYAMTPGNRWLFESLIMQKKLSVLSRGIRETFHLQAPEGSLIWEQYLYPEFYP